MVTTIVVWYEVASGVCPTPISSWPLPAHFGHFVLHAVATLYAITMVVTSNVCLVSHMGIFYFIVNTLICAYKLYLGVCIY